MKKLFGILNLLICLELIVGPNFPGLKVFTTSVAKAETCPAGLVFDSTLNRCITSDQQAELINATASCNGDKECYKRIAEDELKKGEEEGKITKAVKDKGGLFNGGLKIVAIATPLIVAFTALSVPKKCASASMYAMTAGSVVQLAGHFMTNGKHKKCLEKIRKDWEANKAASTEKTDSGVTKATSTEGQSEAFEMLAKSEECMEKTAKAKAGFFAASTVAFGASAVLAGIELARSWDPSVQCVPTTPTGYLSPGINFDNIADFKYKQKQLPNLLNAKDLGSYLTIKQSLHTDSKSCASIEDYELTNKNLETLKINEAAEVLASVKTISSTILSQLNPFRVEDAQAADPVTLSAFQKLVLSPTTRLILSGILAGWSAMMWSHAKKQARAASNRAEFLRKLKDDLNDATGAISCTPEERSVPANANCYCYTESGQRNQARANSQVCQQLWSGQSIAKAGNYDSLDFSTQKVCISSSGAADETCACKQSKSCLNAIPGTAGNLGLGAISVASNGMKPSNDLANGVIGAGSINGAAALQGAARLLDRKNELTKKAKLDPNKQKAMAKNTENALITAAAGQPSPLLNSQPLPLNMSAADAAKVLENELNGARSFEAISGSPAVAQPGSQAVDDDGFKFENPEVPAAATDADKLAEVMKDDFNYANNDITASDSNLFQILTNRYQRSGMRRLFDEEGKTAPEPASKNDISQ